MSAKAHPRTRQEPQQLHGYGGGRDARRPASQAEPGIDLQLRPLQMSPLRKTRDRSVEQLPLVPRCSVARRSEWASEHGLGRNDVKVDLSDRTRARLPEGPERALPRRGAASVHDASHAVSMIHFCPGPLARACLPVPVSPLFACRGLMGNASTAPSVRAGFSVHYLPGTVRTKILCLSAICGAVLRALVCTAAPATAPSTSSSVLGGSHVVLPFRRMGGGSGGIRRWRMDGAAVMDMGGLDGFAFF